MEQLRAHLGKILRPFADAPQHEIGIAPGADRDDRDDEALLFPLVDHAGEFGLVTLLLFCRQAPPCWVGFEEEIIHKLLTDFVAHEVNR